MTNYEQWLEFFEKRDIHLAAVTEPISEEDFAVLYFKLLCEVDK
jgi:hypothetical protein